MPEQRTDTVLVLGAGATKACRGPLTNEILPSMYDLPPDQYNQCNDRELLDDFLVSTFRMDSNVQARQGDHYPPLPLVLSLIDTAIDRQEPLGGKWDIGQVRELRKSLEFTIAAVLEHQLAGNPGDGRFSNHERLVSELFAGKNHPKIISMNYDVIIDNALTSYLNRNPPVVKLPNYGTDTKSEAYPDARERSGDLLKLHGSLHFLYCPLCHRLELAISETGNAFKALQHLFPGDFPVLTREQGAPRCRDCDHRFRPILITPTQRKDYRNPHVSAIWLSAANVLRRADRVVFVGYSLPEDDVEVTYLLKRNLECLPSDRITVVDWSASNKDRETNPVAQRYQAIFGRGIKWCAEGLDGFLQSNLLQE